MLPSLSVCVYLRAAANWSHTVSVPLWQTSTICFVFLPQGTLKCYSKYQAGSYFKGSQIWSCSLTQNVAEGKHSKMHLKWGVMCMLSFEKKTQQIFIYCKERNYSLISYESKKTPQNRRDVMSWRKCLPNWS